MLPPLVGYKTVVPQGAVISQSLTSLAGLAVNFDHQTQSFKKGAKDNPKKCLPKPQTMVLRMCLELWSNWQLNFSI